MLQVDRECKRKELERTLTAEIDRPVKVTKAADLAPPPSLMQFTPPATEPESFPGPTIGTARIRKVYVNGQVGARKVLVADSGAFYEIGTTLKKAIFGVVVLAMVVKPSPKNTPRNNGPDDMFARTEELRAIKIYSKRMLLIASTEDLCENPIREISALQSIGDSHPNLMGQIECCTDEDNIYSIMRYCPGGELFDFIDERGPLEVPLARSMFRQLLNGLLHLQELGIGHRDMSLENMLFDGVNLFVIIDFGMCLRLKKDPATGRFCNLIKQSVCGKKNYISPEVMRGEPQFNPMLCDIWAAGVILFISLTGVPPVDTATLNDERFRMICDGRLQEMLNSWGMEVDTLAIDLVQRILRPQPQVSGGVYVCCGGACYWPSVVV
jgi:serine/threonine protein kinase